MCHRAVEQYHMIHDIYVLLDDSDRQLLSTFQLNVAQYAVLCQLDSTVGTRQTDLSMRLLIDKSSITRIIDRLGEMGLVERLPDPADRRAQRIVLTAAGAEHRSRAYSAHTSALATRFGILSDGEQHELVQILQKLRDGLCQTLEPVDYPAT